MSRQRKLSTLLRISALALAAPATLAAQNLSPTNPEFDGFSGGDFPGWATSSTSPAEGDDADGCPLSASLRAESSGGNQVFITSDDENDCIVAQEGDVFHLEVTYRSDAPVDLRLVEFPNADCTGSFISTLPDPAVPESAEWTVLRVQKTVAFAATDSVRLRFRALDDTAFFAEFDRAYVGTAERIFADDFEGGSFCRWTEFVDGFET